MTIIFVFEPPRKQPENRFQGAETRPIVHGRGAEESVSITPGRVEEHGPPV